MKKIIYTLALASLVSLGSCTDGFEDTNTSKTGSTSISPDLTFSTSLFYGSGIPYQMWQHTHQLTTGGWVQHFANINPTFTADNYEPAIAKEVWGYNYSKPGFAPLKMNAETISLIEKGDKNPIKMACAKIWNVYMFHGITDSYGDIPYSEAFKSNKAKFDTQQSIYTDMLQTLAASVETLKKEKETGYVSFGTADVIYQGNVDKWIRFANSLTLRLGLRLSNVDPALGKSYVEKVNPEEVILNNAQSAQIKTMTADKAPYHEMKNAIGFVYAWNEVRISETFMSYLDGRQYGVVDPRLKQFAETTKASDNKEYKGLKNGQASQSLSTNRSHYVEGYSNIGPYFNTMKYEVPLLLLTASESNLLLAEAKERGWLTGGSSTQQYYEAAIKTSFDHFRNYWDGTGAISVAEETAYLAANGVAFDAAKALEQIATQKWIALYTNEQEAWSEMRRTGFPKIASLVDPFPSNTEMPRRRLYSDEERKYNKANYDAAVARMGGDSQYTKVWWDGGK
ncbi:MAG: hypothetical protein RL662_700 [Bacteroidota bacterium]|jgi:hypothetical protein